MNLGMQVWKVLGVSRIVKMYPVKSLGMLNSPIQCHVLIKLSNENTNHVVQLISPMCRNMRRNCRASLRRLSIWRIQRKKGRLVKRKKKLRVSIFECYVWYEIRMAWEKNSTRIRGRHNNSSRVVEIGGHQLLEYWKGYISWSKMIKIYWFLNHYRRS